MERTQGMSRRRLMIAGACALGYPASLLANTDVLYGQNTLPSGIRSRLIPTRNGLTMHVLEAGYEDARRPCVVLLHGFPELAYFWRNQLLALAQAGFHAIAPDQRGYGRTATAPVSFEDDLAPYSTLSRVNDVIELTRAMGHQTVACVVGHDWGAPTAQWCALARPDVFRAVVNVSTPFTGAFATPPADDIEKELAALPRPRKHYWWYCASRAANPDFWRAPQGVHDLLRAWFYFKSADWKGDKPFPLKAWNAEELAKLPEYYVMDSGKSIAETMAAYMPSAREIAACRWMTEKDLAVYSAEFARTGFQGGLNYYRVLMSAQYSAELERYTDRKIERPACFIGGARDWGVRQSPDAFESMKQEACTDLRSVHLVDGAGHSVPEERPREVNRLLIEFLRRLPA
jgi:pimeloyl-ACP methyl ester carboxylesterase